MNPVNVLAEGVTAANIVVISAEMKAVLLEAFNGIATAVQDIATIALPVGLGIAGLFLAVRLGIGFFRSVAH